MTMSPSDEWLLALADEKSPEEFTTAELAALRARAAVSPEIRRAIVARIEFEEALHAMLAEPSITAAAIRSRVDRRRRKFAITGSIGALSLVLAAAVGTWWSSGRPAATPNEVGHVSPVAAASSGETKHEASSTVPQSVRVPLEAVRPRKSKPETPIASTTPQEALPTNATREPKRWESVLGDAARVMPFVESAFASFGETMPGFEVADEFPASELSRWIAAVPGTPFTVNEGRWKGKRFAGLEGVAKLLPVWRNDAVLRIAPFDVGEFALHFWNGNEGVTIRFYPHQRPQLLAAYAVTRDGDDPSPETFRLVATDGGRYVRSNSGAIEVRHQDNRLVVTRGSLPLLIVPSAEPPSDVFLEGRMRLRTLAMYRGEPAIVPEEVPHRDLFGDVPVEQLDWIASSDPDADLEKTTGQVTLSWSNPKPEGPRKTAWAAIRLPPSAPSGLCEAVFRIDSLTPGTGLYLGDADGRPIHTLFASESRTAGAPLLAFGWSNRGGNVPEPRWKWDVDPKQELTPAVGAGSWVKLVVGRGGLKTFISGDGVHWGPGARAPERNIRGPMASIGIFAIADDQPRAITVSVATVRELSALVASADAELRHRVPPFGNDPPKRMADWLSWVTATQPDDVSEDAWLRACGLETLARGASDVITGTVVAGLARDAVESDRPVAETLAILHDAALLSDQWSDQTKTHAAYYQQLARRIAGRGSRPIEITRNLFPVVEASLATPVWSESNPWAVPPAAVRNIAAAAAWTSASEPTSAKAARSAAQRVAVSFLPSHPESGWSTDEEAGLARLASWSGEISNAGATPLRTAQFAWQHPLVTEPGREAATLASELEAALATKAYEDAARLLSAIAELSGLVPAVEDADRFIPPGGLIREIAGRHPGLVATLAEQFGPAGVLHVRQSIASGDEHAVRAAAIRYYGTPAAAEARQWLGDRDLAAGRFTEAEEHFAAALVAAPASERATLVAHQRLSAVLAGKHAADAPTESATFGSRTLSAEEFKQILNDLRQTRAVDVTHDVAAREIPKAVAVSPQPRGRFEGDVGRNPGRHEHRRFDWAGRQIGVTLDRGTAYLTNRFQIVAFDVARKSPSWNVGLGNEQGEAHALPNVAFRPIVDGERLYARRLLGRGPELASLSLNDRGKVLWRSDSHLVFASDPVLEAGRLIAVTCASTARSGGPYTLALTRLRTDDGSEMASTPLVVLNDTGDSKPSAQLVATDDGFLVATAGTVLRCDATGRLVWVRRLPFLPTTAAADADQSPPEPPLVIDDRVIIVPPGSRAVACLEATTGRMLWVRPLGELERLVGSAGDVLVVRLADGLSGLDPANGDMLWKFVRENVLEGLLCDAKTVLIAARTALENHRDALSLLRIDVQAGRLLSEQVVRVDRKEEIRCGPLFIHDGTVWGFLGDGWRDPNRTLVEFVPDDALPAVGPSSRPGPRRHWLTHVEPQTRLDVATVLPGWTMTGSQPGNGATFHVDHRGERWVLLTQDGRDRAARFVQRVEIKPGQKLTARVGRDDDAGWTLRLLADGRAVASEPINAQTAADGWRTVTFDLSRLAGRKVTLALDQSPPAADADKTTKAYWKQVSIE
ncbi:MAG: PQQ-binding-like beta-propeller repeat protein [Planctomycetaceae bacterium]